MEALKWHEWKRRLALFFVDNCHYQAMSAARWTDLARSLFDAGFTLPDAEQWVSYLFGFMDNQCMKFGRMYARNCASNPSDN